MVLSASRRTLRLIVDVHVCIRELLYGRKCLLDCFIGLKPEKGRADLSRRRLGGGGSSGVSRPAVGYFVEKR
jgi:hypothetical protein